MDAESRVTAVDAANGERVWSRDLRPENGDGGCGGGIAVVGDRAYVTTGYGQVAALDASNGDPVWTRSTPTPIRAAPTVANGRVYAVTVDSRLAVFDAASVQPAWSHSGIAAPAAVLGGARPELSPGAGTVRETSAIGRQARSG